ncbi:MAG: hypothetical protein JKY54_14360, partial [Flavobacteriales bacterium]|nr:hypothetical protein [Flavobacteriales bacterium]
MTILRVFILFVLILNFSSSIAQGIKHQHNMFGDLVGYGGYVDDASSTSGWIYHGSWTWLHKNGRAFEKGNYDHGKRIGAWKSFSRDGKLYTEGSFEADKMTGLWKTHFEDGGWCEQVYSVSKRDGANNCYYPNGQLRISGYYRMGKSIKAYKTFYEDGKAKEVGNYNEEGNKRGEWKTYHDNEKPAGSILYVNGERQGAYAEYHYNGQLAVKGSYESSLRVGLWVRYHNNGQISREGNYVADQEDGEWKSFHDNGKTEEIANYKQGNVIGEVQYFKRNGEIGREKLSCEEWNQQKMNNGMSYKDMLRILCQQGYYYKEDRVWPFMKGGDDEKIDVFEVFGKFLKLPAEMTDKQRGAAIAQYYNENHECLTCARKHDNTGGSVVWGMVQNGYLPMLDLFLQEEEGKLDLNTFENFYYRDTIIGQATLLDKLFLRVMEGFNRGEPGKHALRLHNFEVLRSTKYGAKHFWEILDHPENATKTYFYSTGPKMAEITFVGGQPEGSAELFWPNGKTRLKFAFKNGQLDGTFSCFNWIGEERTYGVFSQGGFVGEMTMDSNADGMDQWFFDEQNKIYMHRTTYKTYSNQNMISLDYWLDWEEKTKLNPRARFTVKYPNGKVRAQGYYELSLKREHVYYGITDTTQLFNENGTKTWSILVSGIANSKFKFIEYFKNGVVKSERSYYEFQYVEMVNGHPKDLRGFIPFDKHNFFNEDGSIASSKSHISWEKFLSNVIVKRKDMSKKY